MVLLLFYEGSCLPADAVSNPLYPNNRETIFRLLTPQTNRALLCAAAVRRESRAVFQPRRLSARISSSSLDRTPLFGRRLGFSRAQHLRNRPPTFRGRHLRHLRGTKRRSTSPENQTHHN